MQRGRTPEEFFSSPGPWQKELKALRKAVKAADLKEEIKWGTPSYTLDGVNVVGIGAFKSYFGLWFHQGALLNDRKTCSRTPKRASAKHIFSAHAREDDIDRRSSRNTLKRLLH